jgi:hypothetical protein
MKLTPLRVNPRSTLASFVSTTGDKAQASERTGFVPSVKPPNAAPPPQMNIWKRDTYKPEPQGYVRPGANDFLAIKSRGF